MFLPTSSPPQCASIGAIEGWRGVVRSMPMCIYAVGVYTYGIFVEGSYRVCLRHIRIDMAYGLGYRS